jgi:chromosome segregation ATPase
MARPLPIPDPLRNGSNGNHPVRPAPAGPLHLHPVTVPGMPASIDDVDLLAEDGLSSAEAAEFVQVRSENAQLRALCVELEQALHEATQQMHPDQEQQIRDYEGVVEEKNDMIRQLHQQLQEMQAAFEEVEGRVSQPAPQRAAGGPTCEDELLALSEELERERRQLQEDEQALMEQMREMEVSMARERAEMARQRNDLQRLQSEIRHELERLERNGAKAQKIQELTEKLTDAANRRGAAPMPSASSGQAASPQAPTAPSRKGGSLMGRLFGQGK